ncbi:hypothetical protein GLOIN_2v950431 [Rhizophagus clarus]|uniref:Uncharacterized protein n=1 Tax=Rhizophagus clarus TaxID=94130 RepID=A0A8H3L6M7_9GLOM|nr:hypothetical protein GLOIN_2v950431 [Rhizophagus clarus]
MCDEWRLNFIDAGRISYNHSDNSAPWTMNNFTERIHCTIEATYSGKQTVLSFLERLYGVKLSRDNLTESSGQVNFEAGLVTLFNARSIEQLINLLSQIKIHLPNVPKLAQDPRQQLLECISSNKKNKQTKKCSLKDFGNVN